MSRAMRTEEEEEEEGQFGRPTASSWTCRHTAQITKDMWNYISKELEATVLSAVSLFRSNTTALERCRAVEESDMREVKSPGSRPSHARDVSPGLSADATTEWRGGANRRPKGPRAPPEASGPLCFPPMARTEAKRVDSCWGGADAFSLSPLRNTERCFVCAGQDGGDRL